MNNKGAKKAVTRALITESDAADDPVPPCPMRTVVWKFHIP